MFPPRVWVAGPRYSEPRPDPKSRIAFSATHHNIHSVRGLLQLCELPGLATTHRRGARMGAAHSGEETDNAGLLAAPRASLVPQSKWIVEAPADINRTS